MSYAITVWRVDVEKLKSYHGCKDEARLEALLADDDIAEWIAEHDEENEEEIAEGMPSLRAALRNIIMGETTHRAPEDPWGRHVRALELLVDACGGTSLANGEVSPMPVAWVGDIKPLDDLVCGSGPPFPMPLGDELMAGHMSAATVIGKLAELEGARLGDFADGKRIPEADVEHILSQYRGWLVAAKDVGQGLVVTAY